MTDGEERDEVEAGSGASPSAGGVNDAAKAPAASTGGRGQDAGDDWDDWDSDDDWDHRGGSKPLDMRFLAVIGALIILVVGAYFIFGNKDDDSSGGSAATEGGICGTVDWEWGIGGSTEGVTKRMDAGEEGVFSWIDFHGLHLRSNLDEPVTVKVTGDDTFKVKEAGEGVSASSMEAREVTFALPASDGTVGPDIDIMCLRSLTFEASSGEQPLDAEKLQFGDGTTSDVNPRTYRRPE